MEFALWTDDPSLAARAAAAGISRIGPDLEVTGKAARQAGTDSLLSNHRAGCLPAVRAAIGEARLFARCNAPDVAHGAEIEMLVDAGVRSIMLPMVRTVADATSIAAQIAGRAELIVMIEHDDALPLVETLAGIDGVAALYVGINDLALSRGCASRFAVMTTEILEPVAAAAAAHGLGFAFFGVGRADDARLPVPSDLVFAEWERLGASFALLARSFAAQAATLPEELDRVRARLDHWRGAGAAARAAAHAEFVSRCRAADAAAARARR